MINSIQAIGHGISSSFLDKIRHVTKQFFALPTDEKLKYARETYDMEGYGNDPVLSDKQVYDWCDRLFLNLIPQDSRKLHLWPANPSEFRYLILLIISIRVYNLPVLEMTSVSRHKTCYANL